MAYRKRIAEEAVGKLNKFNHEGTKDTKNYLNAKALRRKVFLLNTEPQRHRVKKTIAPSS